MAAENSNKLKLAKIKTYTSTRKSTVTLVTLQSFNISGVTAEKMWVENLKILQMFVSLGV